MKIKDLVQDAAEGQWSDGASKALQYNAAVLDSFRVEEGSKYDFYPYTQTINEKAKAKTVEIDLPQNGESKASEVRGSFVVEIPQFKLVQLEVDFDLFAVDGLQKSRANMLVEVYRPSKTLDGEWSKASVHQEENLAVGNNTEALKMISGENYTQHSFIADLSEYAGSTVRIDLVAKASGETKSAQKVRWLQAKLVGATFRIEILDPDEARKVGLAGKTKNTGLRIYSPQSISYGNEEVVPINDMPKIPDTAVSSFIMNSRTYGYSTDGTTGGSVVFDFINSGGNTFFYSDRTTVGSRLVRSNGYPGSSGLAWFPIQPSQDWTSWENHYTGVHSSFADGSIAHAFLHCEDVSANDEDRNPDASLGGIATFRRIGYARSASGDPRYLNFIGCNDDDGDTGKILESFQDESVLSEYDIGYRAYTAGTSNPSVIIDGYTAYMFYGRAILPSDTLNSLFNTYGQQYKTNSEIHFNGLYKNSICLALANKNSITSSNYSNSSNPWSKYYNGSYIGLPYNDWSQIPTRPPFSTPVIEEQYVWRDAPDIIYDSFLEEGDGEYFLICQGSSSPGSNQKFFMYTTVGHDLTVWSDGMEMNGIPDRVSCPSIFSTSGPDSGYKYYVLYYNDMTANDNKMRRFYFSFND